MRTTNRLLFLIGTLAFGSIAFSQGMEPNREAALQPLSSADGQSPGPTFLDAATIEAGSADTKANIGISGFFPSAGKGNWYEQYSLGGEAAVTKGSDDDATVGTLSGLSKGSSAHASISWIYWKRMTTDEAEIRRKFCRENFKDLIGKYGWEEAPLGGADVGCDSALFTEAKLKEVVNFLEASRKSCGEPKPEPSKEVCEKLKELGEAKIPEGPEFPVRLKRIQVSWKALEQSLVDQELRPPAHFFNIALKTNRAKANYFVETDLTKLKKDHTTGYGGTASYSYFLKKHLLSGGFSLEKTYKNNDEVEVCSPIANTSSLQCITGSIGAPTHTFARIAYAEGRWLLAGGRIGVAPRAEYDFTDSNYAVRVPFYLAPDKKKSLIGGIALGYTNKDDEGFGISVFVGKAFSFFD